jgi:hypothetical protein
MKFVQIKLLGFVSLFITYACTEDPCLQETDALAQIGFNMVDEGFLDSAKIDSISYNLFTGSLFIGKFTDNVLFQLSYEADQTPMVIDFNIRKFFDCDSNLVIDTIFNEDTMIIDTTMVLDPGSCRIATSQDDHDSTLRKWVSDTLIFSHSKKLKLVSHECGFTYQFDSLEIEQYSTNIIDSVKIIDSIVTTDYHENIRIYY